jgi:hypothetical protein
MVRMQSCLLISNLVHTVKTKGQNIKLHPSTGHEGLQPEYRYKYTLSLTSALNRGRARGDAVC